jgi:hypothetical protein
MKIRNGAVLVLIALNAWVLLYIIDLSSSYLREFYPVLYLFQHLLSFSSVSTILVLGAALLMNFRSLRTCILMSLGLLVVFLVLDLVFKGFITIKRDLLPGYLYLVFICPFAGFGAIRLIRNIRL